MKKAPSTPPTPTPACGYDNSTLTQQCFLYCDRLGVEVPEHCPSYCTRDLIEPLPPGAMHAAGRQINARRAASNSTFTQLVPDVLLAQRPAASRRWIQCGTACNLVNITAHNPAGVLARRRCRPAAPCGFSTTLSSNCTNYCLLEVQSAGCAGGVACSAALAR